MYFFIFLTWFMKFCISTLTLNYIFFIRGHFVQSTKCTLLWVPCLWVFTAQLRTWDSAGYIYTRICLMQQLYLHNSHSFIHKGMQTSGKGFMNPEPGTRNPEPGTRNPESGTRNPEPGTRNPEPGTWNPEPRTDNHGSWSFLFTASLTTNKEQIGSHIAGV